MCHRPFYCNITAKVFANRGWKTIESHKSKTKTDSYCCNNFSQIFKQRFRFVLNLVTTSVNKLSVLPTCQPSLPTSLFFLNSNGKIYTGTQAQFTLPKLGVMSEQHVLEKNGTARSITLENKVALTLLRQVRANYIFYFPSAPSSACMRNTVAWIMC